MIKIKIDGYLKDFKENNNHLYHLTGYLEDNCIQYQEENEIKAFLYIKGHHIELRRESREMEMILYFEEGKTLDGIYEIKNYNLKLKIHTKKLVVEPNKIIINYNLILENKEIGTFEYSIEYKEE